MSLLIDVRETGMRLLKDKGFNINKCENCKYETANCKECIKQYFKKKASEG